MYTSSQLSRKSRETWKYALIGGFASIPLTLGLYWLSGIENVVSLNMVFFGGLLAGYLAKRGSRRASSAGIRAGVIGGLPGLVLVLPTWLSIAANFGRVQPFLVAAVLVILFAVVTLGISALIGLLGGKIGGWLSKKVDRQRTSGVGI